MIGNAHALSEGTALHIVVMGVSGCGKSTIGRALADSIGACFLDGDSLHPQRNIDKMASGRPLDDADRTPWLTEVGNRLATKNGDMVIACSALKRKYRNMIRDQDSSVVFIHLDGAKELLHDRMNSRSGHFMPASLLGTQLATLESLQPDERGFAVDISCSIENIVIEIELQLKRT